MKSMKTLSHCVYREKSQSTKELCEAMCLASLRFEPLHFDSTGYDEEGNPYRYASLNAIKKATGKALCEAGIWIHAEYGFDDTGRFICVTIEKDDQWVASYLDIPAAATLRERKAAMTQLRRAAIEGLLDLAAEQDTDAENCGDDAPPAAAETSAASNPKWEENERLAQQAISEANTSDRIDAVLDKAMTKVARGFMNPDSIRRLEEFADVRRNELNLVTEAAT